MTTTELQSFQKLEQEFNCRPNLIAGFVVTMFPKQVSVSVIYSELKQTLVLSESIIAQLFKIREKLLV